MSDESKVTPAAKHLAAAIGHVDAAIAEIRIIIEDKPDGWLKIQDLWLYGLLSRLYKIRSKIQNLWLYDLLSRLYKIRSKIW